ncbi:unnamed protein product, partial [Trichogramma brassicae]
MFHRLSYILKNKRRIHCVYSLVTPEHFYDSFSTNLPEKVLHAQYCKVPDASEKIPDGKTLSRKTRSHAVSLTVAEDEIRVTELTGDQRQQALLLLLFFTNPWLRMRNDKAYLLYFNLIQLHSRSCIIALYLSRVATRVSYITQSGLLRQGANTNRMIIIIKRVEEVYTIESSDKRVYLVALTRRDDNDDNEDENPAQSRELVGIFILFEFSIERAVDATRHTRALCQLYATEIIAVCRSRVFKLSSSIRLRPCIRKFQNIRSSCKFTETRKAADLSALSEYEHPSCRRSMHVTSVNNKCINSASESAHAPVAIYEHLYGYKFQSQRVKNDALLRASDTYYCSALASLGQLRPRTYTYTTYSRLRARRARGRSLASDSILTMGRKVENVAPDSLGHNHVNYEGNFSMLAARKHLDGAFGLRSCSRCLARTRRYLALRANGCYGPLVEPQTRTQEQEGARRSEKEQEGKLASSSSTHIKLSAGVFSNERERERESSSARALCTRSSNLPLYPYRCALLRLQVCIAANSRCNCWQPTICALAYRSIPLVECSGAHLRASEIMLARQFVVTSVRSRTSLCSIPEAGTVPGCNGKRVLRYIGRRVCADFSKLLRPGSSDETKHLK